MESSDMKNIVVIKNLPSNMVEEAIIIFKENQKIYEKELIKNNKTKESSIETKSKECVLKEAEMLIEDYINKIEKNKKTPPKMIKTKLKYNILKYYSIISTIFLIISIIIKLI